MAKILSLSRQLTLTYSWSTVNHGICGHTYEVIEYYWILKDFFDVEILLCEDITPEIFKEAIEDKYNFSKKEVKKILNNTTFHLRPSLVQGKNILFTDGGIKSMNNKTLLFNNIFMFACGDKEIQHITKENYHVLQDGRVYEPCTREISYKKKILFSRFKKIKLSDDKTLIYATKNCRNVEIDMYNDIENDQYRHGKDSFLILASEQPKGLSDKFTYEEMPVKNLFSKFSSYIYTPVPRHFDCSPRFIAECKFYDKEVIYYKIDYIDEDRGLYWRKHDIEHEFETLYLTNDDDIINIIGSILNEEI